jgi:predicted methyltransferase
LPLYGTMPFDWSAWDRIRKETEFPTILAKGYSKNKYDMHFTVEAQKIVADHLQPGNIAIDATAGNGHDTVFLANTVGPHGKVHAIDIQGQAIERLQQTLSQLDLLERVEVYAADHALIEQVVAPKLSGFVDCAMFNLGYLPHSDKSITTHRASTLRGIEGAYRLLKPGGMMTVLVYVGHPGGRDEAEGVFAWIESHAKELQVDRIQDESNPQSPILWLIKKNP